MALKRAALALITIYLSSGANAQGTTTDPTCPAAGGKTYTSGGETFTINCDTNFADNDISNNAGTSFADCITQCVAITNCNTVTYVGGICYFKTHAMNQQSSTGTSAAYIPVSGTGTGTCPNGENQFFTDSTSTQYALYCGTDCVGTSLSINAGANIKDCAAQCDGVTGCNAVSYASPNCYFKTVTAASGRLDSGVNCAINSADLNLNSGSSGGGTLTSPTCPSADTETFNDNTRDYVIHCGTGYPGNDIANNPATNLLDCMQQCDAVTLCRAAVFNNNNNTCFFKSSFANSVANAAVDAAVVKNVVTVGSRTTTKPKTSTSKTKTSYVFTTGKGPIGHTIITQAVPTTTKLPTRVFRYYECAVFQPNKEPLFVEIDMASVTLENCAQACPYDTYFGVANGNDCWCGNSIRPNQISSNNCTGLQALPCEGNSNEPCGGPNAMVIYGNVAIIGQPQNRLPAGGIIPLESAGRQFPVLTATGTHGAIFTSPAPKPTKKSSKKSIKKSTSKKPPPKTTEAPARKPGKSSTKKPKPKTTGTEARKPGTGPYVYGGT